MVKISVEVSDVEMMALEFTGDDPQKWLQKAIKDRAQFSMEYIAGIYRRIYRSSSQKEGFEIPKSLEAIVKDAFARGWLVTEIQ